MKLIETGKYEKIFQQYNGDIIKKISLEKRKIIELKNPLLSDKTPLDNKKDSGILTVILGIGTEEREKNLLPVRIPLDKGLLGYRIFIINKANQSNFLQINTLKDLQKYKVGQQLGWGDIEVWKANGFKVETVNNYEGLFNVLLSGRYDIFPRGILEAENEINSRKAKMPDLAIEKKLMVYYPWPRYFFYRDWETDRKSTRLNSSHSGESRMPSSA